jgi:hypothetical protein
MKLRTLQKGEKHLYKGEIQINQIQAQRKSIPPRPAFLQQTLYSLDV